MLTAERLRALLDYDRAAGVFTWRIARRKCRLGGEAGSINRANRRRYIRIDGKRFLAARLAWLYVHGRWPTVEIDHRDLNTLNDAITNLREATRGGNEANKGLSRANTSGFKGVSWHREGRKWNARIKFRGRTKSLGLFERPQDAAAAYDAAALARFGEFARTNAQAELI